MFKQKSRDQSEFKLFFVDVWFLVVPTAIHFIYVCWWKLYSQE